MTAAESAPDGAATVVVLHDRRWEGRPVRLEYRNLSSREVAVGQRVRAGQILAAVGRPATPARRHLHLQIHVGAVEDSAGAEPAALNPHLWVEPLPGMGVIAGRVLDVRGEPAPGVRIHGVAPAWPEETPSASVETYAEGVEPDPAYGENFAIGDLPAGGYRLYARVDGHDIAAFVEVAPGRVTWVDLRP